MPSPASALESMQAALKVQSAINRNVRLRNHAAAGCIIALCLGAIFLAYRVQDLEARLERAQDRRAPPAALDQK